MKNLFLTYFSIAVLASLLFIPFLGNVHLFDWDEINFAECAREMIVSGNYSIVQINFEPFCEKPPLFIWMQSLSMHLFGINEFAARFPNAICGIITLLTIFYIGRKIYSSRFALVWVIAFAGSILPHFYFKTAIIDPWFNFFIFLGIYQLILFLNNPVNNRGIILSGLFIGIGMLIKGPVALLIFLLCIGVYWVSKKFTPIVSIKHMVLFAMACVLAGGSWFGYLLLTGNSKVVVDFIFYQIRLFTSEDAGHGGPFFYHFIILLAGCFPASVIAIPSLFGLKDFLIRKFAISPLADAPFQIFFLKWMRILFWVVLILFSFVETKIIHYSSLCYFPLTFLAAWSIHKMLAGEMPWKKWMTILSAIIVLILGTAFTVLPLIEHFKTSLIESGIIKDVFAVENLKAQVKWGGWEWLIGVFWFLTACFWLIKIKHQTSNIWHHAIIFFTTMLTTNLLMISVVPKVEQYTQGAAIEFYQSTQNEDCVIETIGYKSYAQYFYAQQKESTTNPSQIKMHYLVSKITGEEKVKNEYPQCVEIERKNGFIFWEVVME